MIQIQCTNKLMKQFNIEPKEYLVEDNLYKWHANLVTIEDVNCIVLINDLSFYGFIIPNINSDEDLGTLIKTFIERNLISLKASQEQVYEYLSSELVFTKTSSRKLIGKMNSLVIDATPFLLHGESDIDKINLKLSHHNINNSLYVGEYIMEELNKRVPAKLDSRNKNENLAKWDALPEEIKESLINNVFCGTCGISSIVDYEVNNDAHGISLEGKCKKCGNDIARYVEV